MMLDKFTQAVDRILASDCRFERDAYLFVRDALEFTSSQQRAPGGRSSERQAKAGKAGAPAADPATQHVTGQELLDGVRRYAIQQYGPMVPAVFEHWRVGCCEDIGVMVFNLIEAGVFGKTERDTLDDFRPGYDFHEAFVQPFLPEKAAGSGRGGASASGRKTA